MCLPDYKYPSSGIIGSHPEDQLVSRRELAATFWDIANHLEKVCPVGSSYLRVVAASYDGAFEKPNRKSKAESNDWSITVKSDGSVIQNKT